MNGKKKNKHSHWGLCFISVKMWMLSSKTRFSIEFNLNGYIYVWKQIIVMYALK